MTFVELASLHQRFVDNPPEFGPLAALQVALQMLGRQWDKPGSFVDDTGAKLDLCGGSPAMFRKSVAAALRRSVKLHVFLVHTRTILGPLHD